MPEFNRRKFVVSRDSVYAALDSERAYQDHRWNAETTSSEGLHSIEEWTVYMQDYLNEAVRQLSRNASPYAQELALQTIRKITAMGVACMEQHGAPRREGF